MDKSLLVSAMAKGAPLRSVGEPEDIAGAVLYLASDAVRFHDRAGPPSQRRGGHDLRLLLPLTWPRIPNAATGRLPWHPCPGQRHSPGSGVLRLVTPPWLAVVMVVDVLCGGDAGGEWGGDAECETMAEALRLKAQMDARTARWAAEFQASGAWQASGAVSAKAWLVHHCHLSPPEAGRLLRWGRAEPAHQPSMPSRRSERRRIRPPSAGASAEAPVRPEQLPRRGLGPVIEDRFADDFDLHAPLHALDCADPACGRRRCRSAAACASSRRRDRHATRPIVSASSTTSQPDGHSQVVSTTIVPGT